MSIPYTTTGRTAQKTRTYNALVDAARTLVGRGLTPTVEDAAAEADISRTTAYRYFPNQRELLAAAFPMIEASSLLGEDAPSDVEARVERVLDEHFKIVLENESAMRIALRLSLEGASQVLRQGRMIGWLTEAIEPLNLSKRETHRLACAIRATVGIEALVWLTDVAGFSRKDAVELMRSSARTLVRAARS